MTLQCRQRWRCVAPAHGRHRAIRLGRRQGITSAVVIPWTFAGFDAQLQMAIDQSRAQGFADHRILDPAQYAAIGMLDDGIAARDGCQWTDRFQ